MVYKIVVDVRYEEKKAVAEEATKEEQEVQEEQEKKELKQEQEETTKPEEDINKEDNNLVEEHQPIPAQQVLNKLNLPSEDLKVLKQLTKPKKNLPLTVVVHQNEREGVIDKLPDELL